MPKSLETSNSSNNTMDQTVRGDIESGGSIENVVLSHKSQDDSGDCYMWFKCLCCMLPPFIAIIVVMASLFGAISEDKKVNVGFGVGCFVFLLCHWGAIRSDNV